MTPLSQIPHAAHDPAKALTHRCREFAETAELIKSRLRDYQCMASTDNVTWAHVGSVTSCVSDLERIAAFLNIPGYSHR